MKKNSSNRIDAWIEVLTRRAVNAPWVFLATGLLVFGTSCVIASRLEVLVDLFSNSQILFFSIPYHSLINISIWMMQHQRIENVPPTNSST